MPATVTLENLTRRPLTVILDHRAFRDKKWGFRRIGALSVTQNADGTVTRRPQKRSIIGSLRIPPGGKASGLHPAIEFCSQVQGWLASGSVRIKPEATPPEPQRRGGRKPASEKGDSA